MDMYGTEQQGRDLRERLNARNGGTSGTTLRPKRSHSPCNHPLRDHMRDRSPVDGGWQRLPPWHRKWERTDAGESTTRRRHRRRADGAACDQENRADRCARDRSPISGRSAQLEGDGARRQRATSDRTDDGDGAGNPRGRRRRATPDRADVDGDGGAACDRRGARPPRDASVASWPRERCDSDASTQTAGSSKSQRARWERETDPAVLARRQKQLEYGYNTLCYQQYITAVPKNKRESFHPRSPQRLRKLSRRRWDWAVKMWRMQLHYWNDPVKLAEMRQPVASETGSVRTDASSPEPKADISSEQNLLYAEAFLLEPSDALADGSDDRKPPHSAARSAVKPETGVSIKLEPDSEMHDATKAEPVRVEESDVKPPVKTEAAAPDVVVKREPASPAEDVQTTEARRAADSSLYLEEHAEDERVFDWADDLEDLANELDL